MPDPITLTDCAALIARSLAVGVILTERLLDLPPDSPRNPATDYHFLSRAMRQSVLLVERIANPAPPDDRQARRTAARQQIIRAVEDAIAHRGKDRDPDVLRAELLERLDDDALDSDLDTRPTPDIIADLCRDLRLVSPMDAHHFKRRTPADIADLRALAAKRPLPVKPRQDRTILPAEAKPIPEPVPARVAPPPRTPKRAPLSTPSLILPGGADQPPSRYLRPEAQARDQR